MKRGVTDYVVKPFDRRKLTMAVHDSMDTQLAKAIHGVAKWEPHSAYR